MSVDYQTVIAVGVPVSHEEWVDIMTKTNYELEGDFIHSDAYSDRGGETILGVTVARLEPGEMAIVNPVPYEVIQKVRGLMRQAGIPIDTPMHQYVISMVC